MNVGDFINSVVGAKYKVGGKGPEYDCYGIVCAYYREVLGVILPEWDWDGGRVSAVRIIKAASALNFSKIQKPFDGCIVKADRGTLPVHVGVYHSGRVLHCGRDSGTVFEPISQFAMQFKKIDFYVPS